MQFSFNYIFLITGLFLLQTTRGISQQTINLQSVDAIIYNKNNAYLGFLEQNDKNEFRESIIYFNKNYNTKLVNYKTRNRSSTFKTLEEIVSKNEDILYIKDLDSIKIEDLISKPWKVIENHKPWFRRDRDSTDFVVSFLTKNISSVTAFYFGKKTNNVGFGSYVNYPNDDLEKWRVENSKFYSTLDLNLGNNKHIYMLIEDDDIKFVLLPTKEGIHLISNHSGISTIEKTKAYKLNSLETFEWFNY